MAETIDSSYKQPNKPRRKGTGFTNLQRVLQANVGNRLGQAVGSGIQQQAQRARGAVEEAQEEFQQGVQQNRLDTQANTQLRESLLQDPTQAAKGQQTTFQRMLQGNYRGPQGIEGREALQQRAGGAEAAARAATTTGGRLELLRRFAAPRGTRQQYTVGQQRLDAMLLGGSPESRQALQQGRRSALGLQDYLQAQTGAATGVAQQAREAAGRVGEETQQMLSEEAQRFYGQLEEQRAAAEQERQEQYQEILDRFTRTGQLPEEAIDEFGLRPYLGNYLSTGFDDRVLTVNPEDATIQATARAEDIARMQALQQLTGGLAAEDETREVLGTFEGMTPEEAQAYQQARAYEINVPEFRRMLRGETEAREDVWRNPSDPDVHAFWQAQGELDRDPSNILVQQRRDELYNRLKAKEAQRGSRTLSFY